MTSNTQEKIGAFILYAFFASLLVYVLMNGDMRN